MAGKISKNKHQALHNLYQTPQAKISLVKGDFKFMKNQISSKNSKRKSAEILAEEDWKKESRINIIKSLLQASFILSLELVLYFVYK